MNSFQPKPNYLPFIAGIILIAGLLGVSIWLYFKSNKNDKNDKNISKNVRQVDPCVNCGQDCGCLKQSNCSNYQSICGNSPNPNPNPNPSPVGQAGPCVQYEDDTGSCSQDGIKAYNNALANQLNYICKAAGKQNQVNACMEMCENGQLGLPMCESCCQSVCMSINCPPAGGPTPLPPPPRTDGKPGCAECVTICRDDPNGMYGITCDQCNKRCA